MRSAIASFAFLAGALLAAPVAAAPPESTVTGQVLPEVVPVGAVVSIDIFNCPAATTTIEIEVLPQGGASYLDDAEAAVDGAALFTAKVPIDAALGTHVVRVWCRDEDATEVDTTELTFQVAALGLQLSPSSGPVGTRVTARGAGCPTGRTELAFVWIEGASDETPVWDPTRPGTGAQPNEDGSFAVTFTVPAGSPLGENLVSAWCVSEGGSALTGPFMNTFVVTEGTLPPSGFGSSPLLWVAVVLLLGGVAALLSSRAARH